MNLVPVIMAMFVSGLVIANKRVKRILYGDLISTFGQNANYGKWKSPYDALYYSVTIKAGWGYTVFETDPDDVNSSWALHEEEKRQFTRSNWNTRCGGSFLTPVIVQTACHCVAHFYGGTANQKVVWEEPMVIMATVDLDRRKPWGKGWYSPKRYYAHRRCSLYQTNVTRFISYDYGVITLAKGGWGVYPADVDFPTNSLAIKSAPVYVSKDLNFHYLNILRKQAVCLHVGQGYSVFSNISGLLTYDRRVSFVKGYLKRRLRQRLPRHTWRVAVSYQYCYDFIQSVLDYNVQIVDEEGKGPSPGEYDGPDRIILRPRASSVGYTAPKVFDRNYTVDSTFACSMNAGKTQAVPSVGDGGYPVTCNNIYFAVQGMGWPEWSQMDRMSLQSPIVFSKWENSLDYREDFIEKMVVKWYPAGRRFFKFAQTSSIRERNASPKSPRIIGLLVVFFPIIIQYGTSPFG